MLTIAMMLYAKCTINEQSLFRREQSSLYLQTRGMQTIKHTYTF
jgi:hypothetical protein